MEVDNPKYFEGYQVDESHATTGRTITEADIVIHAGHTGDFYPHHMDAEWVKSQPFGQRIAHGTLIFSVAVGMTAGAINPVAFTYGYDRLRFIKPVFIGDTLRVTAIIEEKQEDPKRPNYGFVHEKCTVANQRDETVLVFTHVLSVERESQKKS